MSNANPAACTRASHLLLQADDAAFVAASTHVGFMDDGDGGKLELRNPSCCNSTLARVVVVEIEAVAS